MNLITRLKALTGPSREIDAEIALEVHPWLRDCPRDDRDGDPGWMTKDGRTYASRYTASIDAALTLAPKDWAATVTSFSNLGDPQTGERTEQRLGKASLWQNYDGHRKHTCERAATPAIALLIAIMQAKQAAKQEMDTKPSEDKPK
jgi:hypothetical protein